jgi:unsaturated rhamnogalacturonyl hydrolase
MHTRILSGIFVRLSIILSALVVYGCMSGTGSPVLDVEVTNGTDSAWADVVIQLDQAQFIQSLKDLKPEHIRVMSGEKTLTWQMVDLNMDGQPDQLLILTDLGGREFLHITIDDKVMQGPELKKRTQAELSVKEGGKWELVTKENGTRQYEYKGGTFKNIRKLRVPDEHTDHSFYVRYEGPGWESDKVGYRFYLDWRNATDIFGKKTPEMVLQDVGQDGFESYHEPADWGMDILKVGSSLGIGSFGYWTGSKAVRVEKTDSIICEIIQNGIIRSAIETNYYGWSDEGMSVDLRSIISIDAGSRLSHVELSLSDSADNLCTGIVKHSDTELITKSVENGNWAYISTYGIQSLNNDKLGMALFYDRTDMISLEEDEENFVVVLNSDDGNVQYYFAAVWESDLDRITDRTGFINYLDATLFRLNNPVQIQYVSGKK